MCMVTSCGFKLRGDYDLPSEIQQLHLLSSVKNAPLQRTLRKQLKTIRIAVFDDSQLTEKQQSEIDVTVFLQKEKLDRRLLSLFATGQVAEYELVYTVNYHIQFPGQEAIDMTFDVTREYQDDPDAVLAKSRELDLILGEMRQQAANRIIRQIASSYNNWQHILATH